MPDSEGEVSYFLLRNRKTILIPKYQRMFKPFGKSWTFQDIVPCSNIGQEVSPRPLFAYLKTGQALGDKELVDFLIRQMVIEG